VRLAASAFVAIRVVSRRSIPIGAAVAGSTGSARCFFNGYARTEALAFAAASPLWSVRIGVIAVSQAVLDRNRNILIDRA